MTEQCNPADNAVHVWVNEDGTPDPVAVGVYLTGTDDSLFDGAPPIRSYSDGSQVYGPYARSGGGRTGDHRDHR